MHRSPALLLCLVCLCLSGFERPVNGAEPYPELRARMVRTIEADVVGTSRYLDLGDLDDRVLEVMGSVPRHRFVPDSQKPYAYENRPLPIGHGQTISQPFIVALMTGLLEIGPAARVLEVGTGSGYQAAILSRLAAEVYSIEIIEPLAQRAAATFDQLGYDNIRTKTADGYYGWPEHAPFDAIIVTASAGHVPPPLIEQLKPGSRMVIPVGSRFQVQQLLLVTKEPSGEVITRPVLPVRFVPLTGGH